jgi:quercetin dioxygenase-like cupin family protein
MSASFIFREDLVKQLPEAPADSVISQTLVKNDFIEVSIFKFAQGQELSEHTSAFPAIVQIIEGEGSMGLGKESVSLKPGAWVYMEPNLPHSLKTITPMVMLLTQRK